MASLPLTNVTKANLIHPQSCPATKTELDLWVLPPTQMAIDRKYEVEYRPVAALTGEAPLIEFLIPSTADVYYDLDETYIEVRLKVSLMKTDAAVKAAVPMNAAARKLFSPVNNTLHSLFQRIDLELNGKLVTATSQHYPYRAYLETLLNYDDNAMRTHLQGVGWERDTDFGVSEKRAGIVEDDGTMYLYGKLRLDLFNQGRLLIGGMETKLTLQAHRPQFYFIAAATYSVEVEWSHVALFLTVAKLHSPILSAQEKALAQNPAKYPITRVEVKNFIIGVGHMDAPLDQVFNGQLPRRMFLVLVDNAAENGSFALNPFKFEHFDVNYLACWVNQESYPSTPMTPDFEKKKFKRDYQALFTNMEQVSTRPALTITPAEFANGYTIFSWNFSPDYADGCSTHWNVVRRGYVRMHLRFAKAMTKVVTGIIVAEFDSLVQIDKDRNVVTDY